MCKNPSHRASQKAATSPDYEETSVSGAVLAPLHPMFGRDGSGFGSQREEWLEGRGGSDKQTNSSGRFLHPEGESWERVGVNETLPSGSAPFSMHPL